MPGVVLMSYAPQTTKAMPGVVLMSYAPQTTKAILGSRLWRDQSMLSGLGYRKDCLGHPTVFKWTGLTEVCEA